MSILDEVRNKIAGRRYELSKHAVDQCIIRDSSVREIEEAMTNRSEVIEDYPDDKYGPSEEASSMKETMIKTELTYSLELGGMFYLVEHVPARVCRETGEQYFSPETVERIRSLIRRRKRPDKVVKTPVYEYA